jgi:hypothetical protein
MRAASRTAAFGFRVVVDVEVFGLEDLEIKRAVLDFVLPEVLRGYGGGPTAEEHPGHHRRDRELAEVRHGAFMGSNNRTSVVDVDVTCSRASCGLTWTSVAEYSDRS